MVLGNRWGLRFPDTCLIVEEKPQKKPQPEKLTKSGIEPGTAGWEVKMSPIDQVVAQGDNIMVWVLVQIPIIYE